MNEKKNLSNHHEVKKEQEMRSRRHFLKKAAYAAPSIVALGYLARPTSAMADSRGAVNDDPNLGTPKDFW